MSCREQGRAWRRVGGLKSWKARHRDGPRLDAMKGCKACVRNGHTLFVHMKINNPTLHDKEELNKLPKSGNDAVDRCLKIGLDIELRRVAVVAVQSGGAWPRLGWAAS